MTEDQLQREVESLCQKLGLLFHHCCDSKRCRGPRGLPDLIIVGRSGVLFRELKSEDGETSAEQDRWGWYLGRDLWRVWRPADLTLGLIQRDLEEIC